jgi:3-hydroxybutyryl-CoA dehydrogenase
MTIDRVGVVGCGIMGAGIALLCARAGYPTHVLESSDDLLQRGLANIRSVLRRDVDRNRMTSEDMDTTMALLSGATDVGALAECDIVVEAVVEDLAVKRDVFAALDRACRPEAILASNTSSLPVVEMASATGRPERVVGIHFFNPAAVMKLVEVVATIATSAETVEAAKGFAEALGKTPILVKDQPGFIVNRLLVPYLLDAIRLYDAGVASREDVDQGVTLGLNHPMGPLALADLIGLDVVLAIAETLHRELGEARLTAPPLLRRMVAAGRMGRKTRHGFYEY